MTADPRAVLAMIVMAVPIAGWVLACAADPEAANALPFEP